MRSVSKCGPRGLVIGFALVGLIVPATAQSGSGSESQSPSQSQSPQSDSQSSSRFVGFDTIRGAAIYSSSSQSDQSQSGQSDQSQSNRGDRAQSGQSGAGGFGNTTGGSGKLLGTIEDVLVPEPSGSAAGGTSRDTRQQGGDQSGMSGMSGMSSNGAKAIVLLAVDTGGKQQQDRIGIGAQGQTHRVAVPLNKLQWQASQRRFTCSMSAQDLSSLPEVGGMHGAAEASGHRIGGQNQGGIGGGQAGEDQGRIGGNVAGGNEGNERSGNRAGGEAEAGMRHERTAIGATTNSMGELRASQIAMARARTSDGKQDRVQGLVFDLQQGDVGYVLVASQFGNGMQDESGMQDRSGAGHTDRGQQGQQSGQGGEDQGQNGAQHIEIKWGKNQQGQQGSSSGNAVPVAWNVVRVERNGMMEQGMRGEHGGIGGERGESGERGGIGGEHGERGERGGIAGGESGNQNPGVGNNAGEPQTGRHSLGGMHGGFGMGNLVVVIPIDSSKLAQAPTVSAQQLDQLGQASFREQVASFWQKAGSENYARPGK